MCSEIDAHTRENPEGAMVNQPTHLELTLAGVLRPVYGRSDAQPCTCHPDDNPPVPCAQQYALNECRAKPEAQHFDTEAHRAFMRGLG